MAKKKATSKKKTVTVAEDNSLAVITDNGSRVVFANAAQRDEFTRRCDAQDIKYTMGGLIP
jgi:hypothetical protein